MVEWIGVDVTGCHQFKTGLFKHENYFGLDQVTTAAVGARRRAGYSRPVLYHANESVRLQHAPDRGERLAAGAGLAFKTVEVVQRADQQYPVDGAHHIRRHAVEGEALGFDTVVGKTLDQVGVFSGGFDSRCD